jgi:AraC family transcriptional regulator of adaptative response/methylated-DNA-[protein]-cysteine methyltransferase
MTFHAYCRGRRLAAALQRIRRGADLDEVIMDSGYESHSGFRDAFTRTFGRPPGRSRELECVALAWIESPLGPLVAGGTSQGVCLLEFSDRRMLETQFAILRRRLRAALVPAANAHVEALRAQLAEYFAGRRRAFDVPLVFPGTPFEQRVWRELQRIPYGRTTSYEELARRVGEPGATRAVGRANGCNRIAIVIPCHRVVNKDGKLGGYGGGLWRKERLLELERGEALLALEGAAAEAAATA